MSIKTTFDISRETALNIIEARVKYLPNEQIAEILLTFPESHFRNYRVYDELKDSDFCIHDQNDFILY